MYEKRSAILGLSLICLFCAGISLIANVSAHGQGATLSSQWQGTYTYPSGDNRAPVPFTMQLSLDGPALSGKTSEPATFGNGSSAFLYGNIVGKMSGTSFAFTKTYDGTGGVKHSVEYQGTLSRDGTVMSGTWNIKNFSGSFAATAMSR